MSPTFLRACCNTVEARKLEHDRKKEDQHKSSLQPCLNFSEPTAKVKNNLRRLKSGGPKDHINTRMPLSGAKAQEHTFEDPSADASYGRNCQ